MQSRLTKLCSEELENTAPRIKSDFKPEHADLVEGQKRKRLRKERRIKRIITVILGYAVMAWMIYLIMVTARSTTKVYDPYDVLGVSRVCVERGNPRNKTQEPNKERDLIAKSYRAPTKKPSPATISVFRSSTTPIKSAPTPPRMRRWKL